MKNYTIIIVLFCCGLWGCNRSEDSQELDVRSCKDENLANDLVGCSEEYKPVCGCDGNTYANACSAEFEFGITSFINGPCEIEESCVNIEQLGDVNACESTYAPVCGFDGLTYPNACVADSSGIMQYQKGICGEIDFKACPDASIKIGVMYASDQTSYQWSPNINLSCSDCPRPSLLVTNDTLYTLIMSNKNDLNEAPRLKSYRVKVQCK